MTVIGVTPTAWHRKKQLQVASQHVAHPEEREVTICLPNAQQSTARETASNAQRAAKERTAMHGIERTVTILRNF